MLYPSRAPVLINSTVAAARARVRRPTLSEQRAELQRKETEAAEAVQVAREAKAANGGRAAVATSGTADGGIGKKRKVGQRLASCAGAGGQMQRSCPRMGSVALLRWSTASGR